MSGDESKPSSCHRCHRSLSMSPVPFDDSFNYEPWRTTIQCLFFSDLSIQLARDDLGIEISSDSSDEEDDDNTDDDDIPNNRELLTSHFLRNLYDNNDKLFIVRYLAWSGQTPELKRVLRSDPTNQLIGSKNSQGDTVLHMAVQEGRIDTATYLIRKKPELAYDLNGDGISPLYLAVKRKFGQLVRYIFRRLPGSGLSMDIRRRLQGVPNTAVAHAAVKARDIEILRTIFSNLPDLVDSKNERGWKPISYAAYRGYYDEVCYFVHNFPNCMKECEDDGSFPIHKAISGGHLHIVTYFISSFPKLMFQKDRKRRTVLHIAARYGRMDVLHYFMKMLEHELGQKTLKSKNDDDGSTYKDFLELKDIDGNTYEDLIPRYRG